MRFVRLFIGLLALCCLTGAYQGFPPAGTWWHLVTTVQSDNATNIKSAPGVVLSVDVANTNINNSNNTYYLKFYDTTSTPSCGISPVAKSIPIPPDGKIYSVNLPVSGISFLNGIGICIVSDIYDNGDSAADLGIIINITWN